MVRKEFISQGRVQGVGYRYFCVSEADRLGLTGWTKNELDGTVRCEAQGPEEKVELFKQALEKGPSFSRVEKVEEKILAVTDAESDFEVHY